VRRKWGRLATENETDLPSYDTKKLSLVVDASDLNLGREIGKGNFGLVYLGTFKGIEVAIKSLKIVTPEAQKLFLAEAEIMKQVPNHLNIVCLIGFTIPPGPIYIVSEFCSQGSLESLIYGTSQLSVAVKNSWALDIAKGMHHLHTSIPGIQLIHRDLAARNVLLKKHNVAAVCDFGLARLKMEESNYAKTQASVGPLKWMSPEALVDRKYSQKSDVFSYGVVLYEIFARSPPWPNVPHVEVASRVISGNRMKLHHSFPSSIKTLITNCWKGMPEERPSFFEIIDFLETTRISL